jgi:hypothetical protein
MVLVEVKVVVLGSIMVEELVTAMIVVAYMYETIMEVRVAPNVCVKVVVAEAVFVNRFSVHEHAVEAEE